MDSMNAEEEWLASSLKEHTRLHHRKAMQYLKEFLRTSPEQMLKLRQEEGKRFGTRIVMFWKWLQETKGFSDSTASSYCFGVSGFFSYYDLDLKLRGKIPDTKMRIETYKPNLEDIQKVFRLGDLEIKGVLGIMRDVPCRVGDLVTQVIPRVQEKEFLIESEKEAVVGKCYISEETLELHSQLEQAGLRLPNTKRGIAKLLERACRISQVHKWNPHLLRKHFFTVGCNLNINRDILRILMFKSVPKDILTYLLNRTDLKGAWSQIVEAIPLENKSNGRVTDLEKRMDLIVKALKKDYKLRKALKPSGITISSLQIDEMSEDEFLEMYIGEEGECSKS